MKTYEYSKLGVENLLIYERPDPTPLAYEVTVKIHAVSLNYRDLMFARGHYNPHPRLPAIPCSDGAGEVSSVGDKVSRWKVGDRVCPIFMQGWMEGPITNANTRTAIGGGDHDGVLREYGVFHENGLVRIPDHLSYEEASTLPCAAVTAWNALVRVGKIKAGDTILTMGTGGVSIFAIQFAKMHGARVIATSSSDEKLMRARQLGANETVNYRTIADWDLEVLRLTKGLGVDHIVEVGGAGTLPRSINAARVGGLISVIGVLSQGQGLDPVKILKKYLHVQGIFVGSRHMFEEMNKAISACGLIPRIDRIFGFDQAPAALEYLQGGAHFGKVVIRVVQ
jgi:NADPH:quinone reductase-like Zn-dependent oxidoreductase